METLLDARIEVHPLGIPPQAGRVYVPLNDANRLQAVLTPRHGLGQPDLRSSQRDAFLLFGAVAFFLMVVVALVPSRSSAIENTPLSAEMHSLEHLAKATVNNSEQLEHERVAHRRANENLLLQEVRLNRALSDQVRLGRDLHDGVIQSLYATGLTLETADRKLDATPLEARPLIKRAITTLNECISRVRAEIKGLTPEAVRQPDFVGSLQAVLTMLDAGRGTAFHLDIKPECAALVADAQLPDVLQIVTESVSNALRHGNASEISIQLQAEDRRLALLIQDNGRGFDVSRPGSGHGLANLRARSDSLEGELRITSTPDAGTRVLVLFSSAS